MPISPIGGMIYANQNMHVAAAKQLDHQGRIDFQNLVAASLTNDKIREVQETRALEEDQALDSEKEHNKNKSDENSGEKSTEEKDVLQANKKNKALAGENKEIDDGIPHILDIRV